MRTINIPRIGYRIPAIELDEHVIYTYDLSDILDGDTIQSHTYAIYDSSSEDVTDNFAKDSSMSDSICSTGVKGYSVGRYTMLLWFLCNEYLPDGVTLRKFKIETILTIK